MLSLSQVPPKDEETDRQTYTERDTDTDTDTDFIVKATDPYIKGGRGGGGGCTIAFLCLQSHNIIVEDKKQVYSLNHTFTRAVFL